MINSSGIIDSLPGNVLANIIATAITAGLALIFGLRGKENNAPDNIIRSEGQRIHIGSNNGSFVNNMVTNSVSSKTINNYGSQRNNSTSDDESVLFGFIAIFGLGSLLVVSKLVVPIIAPLPLYSGGVTALVASLFLYRRRSHYTSEALKKAVLGILGLLVSSILAYCAMFQAQDLENPYSLLSISERSMEGSGSEKILTDAIPRFLYLASNNNQKYLYAFMLSLFAIFISWLVCIYYLKIVLGSLLFPASSNGRVFNQTLSSFNASFIESRRRIMLSLLLLACIMFYLTAPGSFEQLADWAHNLFDWLGDCLKNL